MAAPVGTQTSVVVKLIAALAVVVLMLGGIFFFGRLADDDRAAMAMTTGWFGVVAVGGYLLARTRRGLLVTVGVAYAVVALAAGVVLGLPLLGDDEVNEQVVVGAPAGAAEAGGGAGNAGGNVELASGSFEELAHPGSGTAAVVELPSGERKLTFTGFETDNGPDLRVYLSTGDPAQGDLGDFEDLGSLKGNIGDQQYDIPRDVDIEKYSNAVVWCRAFSVGFTSAPLSAG